MTKKKDNNNNWSAFDDDSELIDELKENKEYFEEEELDDDSEEELDDDSEEELDDDSEEPQQQEEPFISNEEAYKFVAGLIDNSRAMLLSVVVGGDLERVNKYIWYQNWDDPKHKMELQAGAKVAAKYNLSNIKMLPEFMLLMALGISSAFVYKQAMNDKKELKQKQAEERSSIINNVPADNIVSINSEKRKKIK